MSARINILIVKALLIIVLVSCGVEAKSVRSRRAFKNESTENIITAEDNTSWNRFVMEDVNSFPKPGPPSATPDPPTRSPTKPPTPNPTRNPTPLPTRMPITAKPIPATTKPPTPPPTKPPTPTPTKPPTPTPTKPPTPTPTKPPTPPPTNPPTPPPTNPPTQVIPVSTPNPTPLPTPGPTRKPTPDPTPNPTPVPTPGPTRNPTPLPTPQPTPPPTPKQTQPPTVQLQLKQYVPNVSAWDDPTSYQSEALRRTEEQVGSESMTAAKLVQYYSLYCIYAATNAVANRITKDDPRFATISIPKWTFSDGWTSNNVDPCSGVWYGIACFEDEVIGIDLSNNLLTGVFPPEVALFSSENPSRAGTLRALVLLKNGFLYGADLSWITDLGSGLLTLYLQETSLSGSLPKMPKNLFEFDCSFSLITGGLTDQNFEGLNNLNYMVISGLTIGSSIPRAIGTLSNLEFFYAADSLITGDLSYMQGMPKMRQHWVDDNPGLAGPLFPFIGDIGTMQSMSITDNALTGTIPAELGGLTNIEDFWLFGNQLTGTVPGELGKLKRMKFFQVEGNNLSGIMPAEVCANTRFPTETLTVLGADCSEVSCPCCDCCSYDECPNK